MRLIDADALKDELANKVFSNYTSEFWGTMQVIDEMPPIRPPLKLEWSKGVGNDDYHRGYMAGWNMYLTVLESQVVKAKGAKQ